MPADMFYARSGMGGTPSNDAPPVENATPAEAAPEAGTPASEPAKPPEGEAPATPKGAEAPPKGPEVAGVDPAKPEAPPTESTESTELTPEQRLARADELVRMAREEPAKFAAEHSIEMAPRFAKLGHMAQELRKKEASLKEMESSNAEKLKQADEVLSLLERDRVGFVKKYLGEDGMAKLNRAALSQDDPNFAAVTRLEEVIDSQNKRIDELMGRIEGGGQPEMSPENAAHANAYFERKASEFSTDYRHLAEQPENKRLIDFFGADAVRDDAVELVTGVYNATRRELTAEEAWSMLRTEFDERMQKMNGTAPPAGTPPTQQPQQPSREPGAPPDDNAPPASGPDETDFSPAAERRRMAAIAARHSKG